MSNYGNFFLDFMAPFFNGITTIFKGIIQGIWKMLNLLNYVDVINEYSDSLSGFGIFILIISILCIFGLFALLIILIIWLVRRIIKFRKNLHREEALTDEIDKLNSQVYKLKATNEKLMAMATAEDEVEYDENGNVINKLKEGESRFFKLNKNYKLIEKY